MKKCYHKYSTRHDICLLMKLYRAEPMKIRRFQLVKAKPFLSHTLLRRMTEALLEHGPLENVLEVGTGSGYQTAILSPLVRRVYTTERIESLLSQARSRFHQLRLINIRTRHTDGGLGWPQYAPFDGIIVTAAPLGVPLALVQQLRVGGRMVLPVGDKDKQALVRVTKTEDSHDIEMLEAASFVPLLDGVK
jgi:protein-L-isoaspartate(D-aspartate) O-methyltransferase